MSESEITRLITLREGVEEQLRNPDLTLAEREQLRKARRAIKQRLFPLLYSDTDNKLKRWR